MIGAGTFRREQQEYQVDGLPIERFEVDRALQACKYAKQLVELGQLAVRNGNTIADAGRAELLALHENLENSPLAEPGEFRSLGGELLQGLLLAVDLQRRNDRVGRHEIVERHGVIPVSGNSSGGPSKAADHKSRLPARQWEQSAHANSRVFCHHRVTLTNRSGVHFFRLQQLT